MTFEVNSKWPQKAAITIPTGHTFLHVGQGEGLKVFQSAVKKGIYQVKLFHDRGDGWRLSQMKASRAAAFGDDKADGEEPEFSASTVTLK